MDVQCLLAELVTAFSGSLTEKRDFIDTILLEPVS